ncbi:LacI family transcriptional regulator [Bordetella genomosp. 10]|uniref:LacI family transcriptional regulator n=1 Tax=Bordetella genomosp. 10 TaxID=1416804 RepID=A0A261S3Z5_9BORD|nr:tripartite tricarboxylate transporter substrate binding protein [Bordetella genomosp. 10]OZI31203.1 LacI family transcriptional regulator [Bordetella genomosp. 10]
MHKPLSASLAMLAACAAVAAAGPAQAADAYPDHRVTLIVPFVPGGGTDSGARVLATKLSEKWHQSVVVENRGGAGGILGADAVARAKPDGYTLLMGNVGTQSINPYLYGKLPYDPAKAFVPISMVADLPLILVTSPKFKATDLKQIIALGKAEPNAYSYASSGIGNSTHLAMEVFESASGARFRHIPYKGGGQANADVMSGEVPMQFTSIFGAVGMITSGKFRPIAVAGPERSLALPDVPTMKEAGLENADFASWIGVLAPAGTPAPIVEKIAADIREVMSTKEVKDLLEAQGAVPHTSTPKAFADHIAADNRRLSALIRKLGIHADSAQ